MKHVFTGLINSDLSPVNPQARMMSDTTTPVATEAGAEVEEETPAGELTELARLEIRVGKILEVTA